MKTCICNNRNLSVCPVHGKRRHIDDEQLSRKQEGDDGLMPILPINIPDFGSGNDDGGFSGGGGDFGGGGASSDW